MEPLDYLETAQTAAFAAGKLLTQKMGKVVVREKHPADLVTEADLEAQNIIEDILLSKYPEHLFLGEEAGSPKHLPENACGSNAPNGNPLTWIVDPLDGTTNFVHQVPHFCTAIALAQGEEILCGVIFNPITNECFTAAKGKGAFLNGNPIHTSSVVTSKEALIAFSFPTTIKQNSPDLLAFLNLVPVCQAVRRTGSTALNLAYIAAGRFDGLANNATHPWDVAAGTVILREAGGFITAINGEKFDLARPPFLAAANPDLHKVIKNIIEDF